MKQNERQQASHLNEEQSNHSHKSTKMPTFHHFLSKAEHIKLTLHNIWKKINLYQQISKLSQITVYHQDSWMLQLISTIATRWQSLPWIQEEMSRYVPLHHPHQHHVNGPKVHHDGPGPIRCSQLTYERDLASQPPQAPFLACMWLSSDTKQTGSPELDNKSEFFFVTTSDQENVVSCPVQWVHA
jgi:hypothetical protein